jgi:diacylglycerol kinase (ATP)
MSLPDDFRTTGRNFRHGSMKQQRTGLKRLVSAFFFSVAGIRAALQNEAAFRQECALTLILAPVGWWLGQTAVERVLLIGSLLLVLIVELLNSSLEASVDRVGTDYDPLAGRAKDLGSAAVLVSLVLTLLVWVLIGWERFGG